MKLLLVLLLAIVGAAIIWFNVRRESKRTKDEQWLPPSGSSSPPMPDYEKIPQQSKPVVTAAPKVIGTKKGNYTFPVTGESFYQDNLRKIAGTESTVGKEYYCYGVIVHEPHNPHDQNACAVYILKHTFTTNRYQVGHLPKDQAKALVTIMKEQGHKEGFELECKALVKGGWISEDGYVGMYGVTLNPDFNPDTSQ